MPTLASQGLNPDALNEFERFPRIDLRKRARPSARGAKLQSYSGKGLFAEDLGGRILGFGSDAARLFSKIAAYRPLLGLPIGHAVAQIAAITKLKGAKLATRNTTDFDNCGVDLVNPWTEGKD